MPENLDYVFGQSKAQHGSDYKYIEQDIEICQKILNSIVNRTKIMDDLNALQSQLVDTESNKDQLASYQAELKVGSSVLNLPNSRYPVEAGGSVLAFQSSWYPDGSVGAPLTSTCSCQDPLSEQMHEVHQKQRVLLSSARSGVDDDAVCFRCGYGKGSSNKRKR
jgi:hypothetical protein